MRLELRKKWFLLLLVFVLTNLLIVGCNEGYENNNTVKLAYFGNTADLPLLTAVEEGYFEEEGIDVELIKIDNDELGSNIKSKKIDGATCDYRIFKLINEGAKVKISAGLNSGAIEILVKENSNINSIEDMKNKKIGIQNLGEGTMVAGNKLLIKNSINSINDINWSYWPGKDLIDTLNDSKIDGIIRWTTTNQDNKELKGIKSIYKVSNDNIALMQGHSKHGNDYIYMNFEVLSSEITDTATEKAAGILRAWIKGTNKVGESKEACIQKAIDNGYLVEDYNKNFEEVNHYMWMPSVKYAQENIKDYIKIQKAIGLLPNDLNEGEFLSNCFADVLPFWE